MTVERDGRVIARLPLFESSYFGLTHLGQPPLTQFLGPWIAESDAKYATRLGREHQLMSELIDGLPDHDVFHQSFAPEVTNALPFHWQGFQVSLRYTYRLEDLSNPDALWSGFRENVRRNVRKAKRSLAVRDDLGVEAFVELNALTFARQEREVPYSKEVFSRLHEACAARGQQRILFAQDSAGQLHGAVYLVWDDATCYYLAGGFDPARRDSGVGSLLLWEAIQFASSVSRVFDFEGSVIEPIERFFRGFGARQVPLIRVERRSRRARLLTASRELFRALRGR